MKFPLLLSSLLLGIAIAPGAIAADVPPPPRLADLAAAPAATGLAEARKVVQVGQYDTAKVMQLQLKAGTRLPAHAAPDRVLVVVLGGSGEFEISGETVPLHERQVLHLQPGESHGVTAKTDLDLLLVRLGAH